MRFALAALLFALLLASPAPAAPPQVDPETAKVVAVNKAIDNGVQYLRRNWNKDDQWESFMLNVWVEMDGGVTALATLALLNSGTKANDEIVKSAVAYLRKLPQKRTYSVALINMVLAEVRDPADLPRIQANADWLLKTATRTNKKITGWGYPISDPRLDRPDASNTQYALLGLYAAKLAGAKVPEAEWQDLLDLYTRTQAVEKEADRGSWSYLSNDVKPSFTMTTAGVCGLLIARMGLGESGHGLNPATGVSERCGVYPENDAVRKGMNWLGERFAFRLKEKESPTATFYNIYGIERVGRLSGQRFIGRLDWYRQGCDFLVDEQKPDGSWSADDSDFKGVNVISTSFALLFLSKGRSPVLISKLAHGKAEIDPIRGTFGEAVGKDGVLNWNRKHNDARNLTDFCSRELFRNLPLGWQSYDPRRIDLSKPATVRAEVGSLVQSPVLYITGHSLALTGEQEELLKMYIEEGGFVLADACCGSKDFDEQFRRLIGRLFKGNDLKRVAKEHALWQSHFLVPPAEFSKLECLDVGCRTVLVYSPEPLAGYWEETRFAPAVGKDATDRGGKAFQLGANVVAYATGKEPPKQRLTVKRVLDKEDAKAPPKGFVQPVQIKLDEAPPAAGAMRNLMGYLQDVARLDVSLKPLSLKPGAEKSDLFKFKFLYMHGKKEFAIDAAGVDDLRANLQGGGTLLADACCGSPAFDTGFKKFAAELFPGRKLEPIPATDKLFSAKLNGTAIETVDVRKKAGNAKEGTDSGFEKLPPELYGIQIDGRWAVIYSPWDIGCALENNKSTDCLGHTPDSAKKLAAAAVLYSLKR